MQKVRIDETNFKENLDSALLRKQQAILGIKETEAFVSGLFISIVKFLQLNKKNNVPVALVFEDEKGQFLMAGLCKYIPSGGEAAGEYNVAITFNEEDIADAEKFGNIDNTFQKVSYIELDHLGFKIADPSFIFTAFLIIIKTIKVWIDSNNDITDQIALVFPEVAEIVVGIEDGEKIAAIVLSESIKQEIKNNLQSGEYFESLAEADNLNFEKQ